MNRNAKSISLLALSSVLIAVILLSGSLASLDMQLGAPIPAAAERPGSSRMIWDPPEGTVSIPVLRGLLTLVFLILFVYMSWRLLQMVNKIFILRAAAAAMLVLILLAILPRTAPEHSGSGTLDDAGELSLPQVSYEFTPLGQPPQFLQWLVAAIAGIGLALLAYRVLRFEPWQSVAEEGIHIEAERAVQALNAGQDLKNVILRCYQEMSRSLQESLGIERDRAMTVGEFEIALKDQGFPADPVQQLSSLFEIARYGNQVMREEAEKQAIDSLHAIIDFCRVGSKV